MLCLMYFKHSLGASKYVFLLLHILYIVLGLKGTRDRGGMKFAGIHLLGTAAEEEEVEAKKKL